MKFYNPWKPHIVKDGKGVYRIRIMYWFMWFYLTPMDNWFPYHQKYLADHDSYVEAHKILAPYSCRKHNEILRIKNSKIEKVIHEN